MINESGERFKNRHEVKLRKEGLPATVEKSWLRGHTARLHLCDNTREKQEAGAGEPVTDQ